MKLNLVIISVRKISYVNVSLRLLLSPFYEVSTSVTLLSGIHEKKLYHTVAR